MFFFAFLAYLQCTRGIKFDVGFLIAGHTHEDIDQKFSPLRVWMNAHFLTGWRAFIRKVKEIYANVKFLLVPVLSFLNLRDWIKGMDQS
jgi:hypothetical protein